MVDFSKKEIVIVGIFLILLVFFMGVKFTEDKLEETIIESGSGEVRNEESLTIHGLVDSSDENNDIITDEKDFRELKKKSELVVDICGAVLNPGVFTLEEGSRVIDAVTLAGGLLDSADRKTINLARVLTDGEQIYIPEMGEEVETDSLMDDPQSGKNPEGKININSASQRELETLNGIGQVTAEKILNYRKENGEFSTIEDIMKVSGIGTKKFENIKDNIYVK